MSWSLGVRSLLTSLLYETSVYPSGTQKRRNAEFKRQTTENENTQSIKLFFKSHDSDCINDDFANWFEENYVRDQEIHETIEQESDILMDSQDKQCSSSL